MAETRSLLVRTWNIAHGRDVPPGPGYGHARRKLLDEMCAVMVEDQPDVVLLQEVPVWAGSLLHEKTGMGVTLAHAYGAHVPFVHVPLPLAAGAALGKALPDFVRTQFEGQGQALLYSPGLLLVSARRVQLNERRRLRGEPRIAQLVRLRHRKLGVELAVGNVHADPRGAPVQVEKAGFVLERADIPCVGDCAYLNAGTNGPLPRAAADAMAAEIEAAFRAPRIGARAFERFWEVRGRAREAAARRLGAPVEEVAVTTSTSQGIGLVTAGLDW